MSYHLFIFDYLFIEHETSVSLSESFILVTHSTKQYNCHPLSSLLTHSLTHSIFTKFSFNLFNFLLNFAFTQYLVWYSLNYTLNSSFSQFMTLSITSWLKRSAPFYFCITVAYTTRAMARRLNIPMSTDILE